MGLISRKKSVMSGADRLLLDTNVFIYLLNGNELAAKAMAGSRIFFSFIIEIELLGAPRISESYRKMVREMLGGCVRLNYAEHMHEAAITLRRGGLKVPDAIIAATAAAHGITLLTADRDFASVESIQCVLLEV